MGRKYKDDLEIREEELELKELRDITGDELHEALRCVPNWDELEEGYDYD
jgi:hypothetical protein